MDNYTARAERGMVYVRNAPMESLHLFTAGAPGYYKYMDNGDLRFACTGPNLTVWEETVGWPIEDYDGTLKNAVLPPPPELELQPLLMKNRNMFEHQRRMVSMSLQRPFFGIFHDMGCGKSATALWIASELFLQGKVDQLLFCTVTNNVDQFIDEQIPLHKPGKVTTLAFKFPASKRIEKNLAEDVSGQVLVIGACGQGAFQGAKSFKALTDFVKRGRTVVILDESTGFKGWRTLRHNNACKLREHVEYLYLMSGEPEVKGLEDLFSQFYLLDPRILGHTSMTSFRNEYCIVQSRSNAAGSQFDLVVGYRNKERLYSKIAPHCEFVKINDVIDMPEQLHYEKRYIATAEQRRVYKEVYDDWATILDSGDEALIETAARRFVTLQTVSNGWLKLDDGTIQILTTERVRMVLEECSAAEKKIIVWCRFQQDVQLFKEALPPEEIATFYGLNTSEQNTAERIRFQQDPNVRYFVATTASGGLALNLQVSNHNIYFSNSFNYGDRAQSERRTWRTGQTERCAYIDIIGLPIDRQIISNLHSKRNLAEELKTMAGQRRLRQDLALVSA